MTISLELREYAETPDRFSLLSPDVERFADDRVCLLEGLTWASVSGVNVAADEVAALVAEMRERVDSEKRLNWWIGPSAQPADLVERLEVLGVGDPADGHTNAHALVCSKPPPEAPGIDVRRVETLEDFVAAQELAWNAFELSRERRDQQRPHLRRMFETGRDVGVAIVFLARIEGRPAGAGTSVYGERGVFLIGGAVAEWARRRGVYRALVRARWDDAVVRGTPALVTGALPDTSLPILLRAGFREVCVIRRLEDTRA